jgi:probable HAF family extracellular repeat protein
MDYRSLRGITFHQVSIWVLAVASICGASTSSAAKYNLTLLQKPGGATYTQATAINNAGLVVGYSDGTVDFLGVPTKGGNLALQWHGAVPKVVAFGFGNFVAEPSSPEIFAINNKGDMAGAVIAHFTDPEYWSATFQQFDLDVVFDYEAANRATGINDAGQIVGGSQLNFSAPLFATLWTSYIAPHTLLGQLPGTTGSIAAGINQEGQIVGSTSFANGTGSATLWKSPTQATNLGTLGGKSSAASAINTAGRIVGWADTKAGDQHAALWNRGGLEDLGTLGGKTSSALAINTQGDIVGTSEHKGCCAPHAVLWPNDSNETIDLNAEISSTASKEHTLTAAVGINDKGEIVVNGYNNKTFANESYVLNPSTPVCPAD